MWYLCVLVVGQCGNQIGYRFWDLALREHSSVNKVASLFSALFATRIMCLPVNVYPDGLSFLIKRCNCKILFLLQAGIYDEAMSSFFRNVDMRYGDSTDIPVGDACGKIRSLKARVCRIFKIYLLS